MKWKKNSVVSNCARSTKQNGEYVAVGTSEGVIQMYKWDWFGDCKTRIKRHSFGIECMLKYNENILFAGCEDGWVRVYGLVPMKFRVFENHADDIEEAMAISEMSISRCRRVLASISDDCSIHFYDISQIQEYLDQDKTDWEQVLEDTVCTNHMSDKKKSVKTKNAQFFEEM